MPVTEVPVPMKERRGMASAEPDRPPMIATWGAVSECLHRPWQCIPASHLEHLGDAHASSDVTHLVLPLGVGPYS